MENKRVGAGWIKQGKKEKFISISLEIDGKKHSFTVFKNGFKKEFNHPDYVIYESRKPEDIETDNIPF